MCMRRNPVDGGLGETMDNLPPSSPVDYLRKALSDGRLIDSEVLPRIVLYCERAQPSDAAEILLNIIPGNGEQVITEYLHRRSLGSIYDSKDDSPDKPMQIYRKPEVSLTSSPTAKNKNKVRQSKQATQSIRATDRTHEHDGVSTRPGDNGKEHIQEREGTLSVPLQNLRRGEPCDCKARRHNLLNNCLGCGKVICEQEGEGPCSFCGSEVWHHDRPIQHLRGPSEQISESEEKANVLKNKLLAYDRNEKSQTTIIDDQSDYFNIDGNSWLSPENIIPGNGEQVITEYLHRRSLGSVYDSKDDSPDKRMRIYRKPEVSLTSSPTAKNKNKVRQSKQATQSIRATDRTHEHDGVSTRPGDNGKEHIQEREGTLSVPLQNLRRGEPCDCKARRHNLLNNCLGCGKVICEQEGEGPCSFCGSEVWQHDRPIQHLRGPSEQISESEEKANVLKNKLLAYDRNEKSQTTIIDDQSDYFNIDGNSWLSPEEKKKLQREELEKAENVSQRRTVLLLDPAGRKVSMASEDDIHEDIQRTDVSSYFANRENFQKFHVEPSPNIKTHPVYIDVGKSRQRIDSRSKRIPDSMRISSGRVKHEFSDLHSSTGRAILDAFDICIPKDDTVKLSSPLYVQGKDNDKITKYHEGRSKIQVLKSGLVLLKNWLSRNDQINIVQQCQRLGVGEGGFYQPSFGGNRKMHLWMMCLGNDWDPESRSYGQIRHYDNAVPPPIPAEFVPLVYRAIDESHDALRKNKKFEGEDVERILPYMDPDVCIVNFYKETGRLGLHQGKDESRRSLFRGLPVVSFSLGDSAEFLYGTERDIDKAEKILLESGDVLIFGGESRHVFHGISHVNPHTSPKWLNQETGLRPGRLNLNFRQI